MSDRMNDRIGELLKMLDEVDDFNREIIEKGSVKVEKEREVKKEEKKVEVKRVMSPSSMVKELNKTIIGHPEAKKQLATIFFKYLMERENGSKLKEMGKELTKSSLIITGDSGVGKTFLIQELCRILGMDFLLVDCSNATAEGYKGDSITDKISKLYNICDGDMERIKRSVILLDEFDKAVKSPESNGKDINTDRLKSFIKYINRFNNEIYDPDNIIEILKDSKNENHESIKQYLLECQEKIIQFKDHLKAYGILIKNSNLEDYFSNYYDFNIFDNFESQIKEKIIEDFFKLKNINIEKILNFNK